MKKILLLGGSQFVGKQLLERLSKNNVEITVANRQNNTLPNYENVKYVKIDRYNETDIALLFQNQKFDIIYDMIAYSSYDVKILLQHLNGSEKYIVISSSAVYDNIPHQTLSEINFDPKHFTYQLERHDIHKYKRGKQLVEATIVQKFPHINYAIIRFPYILGQDDYTQRLRKYINYVKQNEEIQLNNSQEKFSFIHSTSAAIALEELSNLTTTKFIVNLADEGVISLSEIIQYIEIKLGKKARITLGDTNNTPYNMEHGCVLDIQYAQSNNIPLDKLDHWLYKLIDFYIAESE